VISSAAVTVTGTIEGSSTVKSAGVISTAAVTVTGTIEGSSTVKSAGVISTAAVTVAGTIETDNTVTASGVISSGAVTASGSALTSDRRLKRNIQTLSQAATKIKNLRGVQWQWRLEEFPDYNFNNNTRYGFIAQEVETVLPDLVSKGDNGLLHLSYEGFAPVLVEALKEQQQQVDDLESRLASVTSFSSVADGRLQRNIHTLTNSVVKLNGIRGVSFNWQLDELPHRDNDNRTRYGFVAEEVEATFPELVQTRPGGWKHVAYDGFQAILVEAVKEQQAEINNLKERAETDRQEIQTLRTSVNRMSQQIGDHDEIITAIWQHISSTTLSPRDESLQN